MIRGGRLGGCVVALLAGFGGAVAEAGVVFEEVQTTPVAIPDGVSPAARIAVSSEGRVVLVTASMNGAHLYPVALGQGAEREIVYTYQDFPALPVSFGFGPGGDLLLRAAIEPQDLDPFGVTTRLSLDGNVVWEQPDSAFADTEAYIGRYEGAAGPIAWSPIVQRVLIFSAANFQIAPVSQGSMLFEFNGDVRVPSILFGDEFIGATLNNALATPDGNFLVYYFSQNDRGTRFFLYDGRESVSFFEPEGGDWANREVFRVNYDPAGNLVLLWVELADSGDRSKARLTRLDPEGKLLWEQDLAGSIEVEFEDPETGMLKKELAQMQRPFFMVTASEEVVLIRQAGPTFVFDVRGSDDGKPLGFYDFSLITGNSVFDLVFLNGSDRNYLLSTANNDEPGFNQLLQVKLTVNEDPVVIDDMNNGQEPEGEVNNDPFGEPEPEPAAEPPTKPDIPEVGCCATIPGRSSPAPWALIALAIGAAALLRRRRS